MRKLPSALLFLVIAALPAAAQQDFSKVQIKVHKVAGAVYMLEGAGGNIGVSVGDDGILLVDDQYAPLAPKIKEALKGISSKPVKFVLNTHYHGDHTGGNEIFGESAPLIAHTNVRRRLAEGEKPSPKGALPVITFDDRLSVHINGEEIRAIHFPSSHTDGDAVIYFTKSNVVHMGDLFFHQRFPYIDLEGGGSAVGLIDSLDRIIPILPSDAKLIAGHGPLGTVEDLKGYRTMIAESVAIVDAGIVAGKTAKQLQEEKVLAKYESLSWQFISTDRFIDALYAELKK